jgi:hypothetical protein
MNDKQFKENIKYLLDSKGIQKVLEKISEEIKETERTLEANSNTHLRCAVEYMFPILMKLLPKMNRKDRALYEGFLISGTMIEALEIIKADSEYASQEMKDAYSNWLHLTEPRGC